jgi:2-iminobutanoate/2-iminopropanoate deaminase
MMPKTVVSTDKAPEAIGAYSQAVVSDASKIVFSSGQIAIDPETGILVKGGIRGQTEQVLLNIEAVLSAARSGLDKVIKVTVYLRNISDFEDFNNVYSNFFAALPPARATVEVSNLPKGALVEMDAIAEI